MGDVERLTGILTNEMYKVPISLARTAIESEILQDGFCEILREKCKKLGNEGNLPDHFRFGLYLSKKWVCWTLMLRE